MPVLIEAMKHGEVNVRRAVADALVAIRGPGGPVLPDLLGALNDVDPYTRVFAARVVARLDPANQPTMRILTDTLEEVLKTDISERPKVVLWALRGFGESAAPAVPAVTHALTDPNANVRHAAAETLGEIGPQALTAVQALSRALNDEAPHVRQAAARALKRIQGAPEPRAGRNAISSLDRLPRA